MKSMKNSERSVNDSRMKRQPNTRLAKPLREPLLNCELRTIKKTQAPYLGRFSNFCNRAGLNVYSPSNRSPVDSSTVTKRAKRARNQSPRRVHLQPIDLDRRGRSGCHRRLPMAGSHRDCLSRLSGTRSDGGWIVFSWGLAGECPCPGVSRHPEFESLNTLAKPPQRSQTAA